VTAEELELRVREVEALERFARVAERVADVAERLTRDVAAIRRVVEQDSLRAGSARVCAQHGQRPRLRAVP
jgi:hypothetical protein